MKENTPTYSSKGKSCLTYPPERCMNKISPFSPLINYIAGITPRLFDSLYTIRGLKWGNTLMSLIAGSIDIPILGTTSQSPLDI